MTEDRQTQEVVGRGLESLSFLGQEMRERGEVTGRFSSASRTIHVLTPIS